MPFETYYRHGSMMLETREADRHILGYFLRVGFGDRIGAIMKIKNLPMSNVAFQRLHALGIIEEVPHLPGSFRIPPHLVKEVGRFVGKPKN